MYLTGFADEAAADIAGQIRVTRTLGWHHIEARNVNGTNLHDLDEKTFDAVAGALAEAGITVNCFGSAIANWGTAVTAPFEPTLAQVQRAVSRMERLGTRLIRIMSFAVLPDRGPDDQMEDERFRRLRALCAPFLDAGIQPVHENCMCYGGMSPAHALRMLEAVPGLRLVFDTGNPVFTPDYGKPAPRPMQSAWDFYRAVRPHIAYVHIKDGVWDNAARKTRYCFPGDGQGDVRRIVADLLASGYDGGFSMEPHMAAVAHEHMKLPPGEAPAALYVEYGRRFERLLAECRSAGDR